MKKQFKASNSNTISDKTKSLTDSIHTSNRNYINQISIRDENGAFNNYLFRFWPRGNAVFGTDGRVSGEFDSVYLSGRNMQYSKGNKLGTSHVAIHDSVKYRNRQDHTFKAEQRESRKTTHPDRMTFIIVIIIFGFILYIRKHFFK